MLVIRHTKVPTTPTSRKEEWRSVNLNPKIDWVKTLSRTNVSPSLLGLTTVKQETSVLDRRTKRTKLVTGLFSQNRIFSGLSSSHTPPHLEEVFSQRTRTSLPQQCVVVDFTRSEYGPLVFFIITETLPSPQLLGCFWRVLTFVTLVNDRINMVKV